MTLIMVIGFLKHQAALRAFDRARPFACGPLTPQVSQRDLLAPESAIEAHGDHPPQAQTSDSPREGMLEGFSLGNHLLLVGDTGRLFCEGKAVIPAELAAMLERLGSRAENWQARLEKLAGGRLLGRLFAATRSLLRKVAQRLGVHRPANLAGCAAR